MQKKVMATIFKIELAHLNHYVRCFFGSFLDKIEFPGQTVNFYQALYVLKTIDLTVNLGHLESILEHPTRHHIFANTVGRVFKLDLTLCHIGQT